jgi:hypothetical protein
MTDKEMALKLGTRLIKSQFRVAALVAELSRYEGPHGESLPWRGNVDETLAQLLSRDAQLRIDALSRELGAANQEDLLRILCNSAELNCGPE